MLRKKIITTAVSIASIAAVTYTHRRLIFPMLNTNQFLNRNDILKPYENHTYATHVITKKL